MKQVKRRKKVLSLFSKKEKVSVCVRAHVLPDRTNERRQATHTNGRRLWFWNVVSPSAFVVCCCRHIPLKRKEEKFVFFFFSLTWCPFWKKESIAASIGLLEVKENKINEWKWSSALAIVQQSHELIHWILLSITAEQHVVCWLQSRKLGTCCLPKANLYYDVLFFHIFVVVYIIIALVYVYTDFIRLKIAKLIHLQIVLRHL